jgi:hypothetical protein
MNNCPDVILCFVTGSIAAKDARGLKRMAEPRVVAMATTHDVLRLLSALALREKPGYRLPGKSFLFQGQQRRNTGAFPSFSNDGCKKICVFL